MTTHQTHAEAATKVDAYVNERAQTGSQEQAVRGAVRYAVALVRNAVQDGDPIDAAEAAVQVAAIATSSRLTATDIYRAGVYYAG